MNELICNLHVHSHYSDGTGNYTKIGEEALKTDVDVVIITDHDIRVKNNERYIRSPKKTVLLLTGEEIHDQNRHPLSNHALVFGCDQEMTQFSHDPQLLIDQVHAHKGSIFLAHPFEYPLPLFHESSINWENWEVAGFNGVELWNGFSEFKTIATSLPRILFYAFFPDLIPHQPLSQLMEKWGQLLQEGRRVSAVAGSDAHALIFKKGFFQKTIFPYRYHFSTINNHLLVPKPLSGNLEHDRQMVFDALLAGTMFIGFDLPASTRGFSFTIEDSNTQVSMGESLNLRGGATLRVQTPQPAWIRLFKNGDLLDDTSKSNRMTLTITESGAYRVEVYLPYGGKQRGWIFSNPIYITQSKKQVSTGFQ